MEIEIFDIKKEQEHFAVVFSEHQELDDESSAVVDNIKQERLWFELPDHQEASDHSNETVNDSVAELRIIVKKFNAKWESKVKLFETVLVCEKCDFVSKRSDHVTQHLTRCNGSENKCWFCCQKFTLNGRKTHELQKHRKGSSWQCSHCPYNSPFRKRLRKHYLHAHYKQFSCETCSKTFAYPRLLKDHQKHNRHGVYATQEIERLKCDECGKTFATSILLYHHKYLSHSQQIHYCHFCEKSFKSKQLVRKHTKIHFKE